MGNHLTVLVNVLSNTTPPCVKTAEGVSIVGLALSLSFMAAIVALAFVAWDFKSIAWSVASCRRRAGWAPWLWTLAFGHHEDRTPTHGYEPTREAANDGVREKLAAGVILRS